jgi:hypothetical protein
MQIMSLKKDKEDALVRAAALQVIERRHWLVAACFKRVCLSTSLKFYYHHNNYLMILGQTELDQLTMTQPKLVRAATRLHKASYTKRRRCRVRVWR